MRAIWTAPLLASAYKNQRLDRVLTHAIDGDKRTGEVFRVLCGKVKAENLCDSSTWIDAEPTCRACARARRGLRESPSSAAKD